MGPTPPMKYPKLSYDISPTFETGAWIDRQEQHQRPVVYVSFGTVYLFTKESCRYSPEVFLDFSQQAFGPVISQGHIVAAAAAR